MSGKYSTTASAHRRAALTGPARSFRVAAFVTLALVTSLAVFLVWPRTPAASAAQRIQVDMSGFSPSVISTTAGDVIRLQLVNPDSQFHSDGGGWHQLAIPELGIDARVAPRSDKTIEIAVPAPGEYAFYCDVCCGGKDNPSMQGVLKVVA